MMTNTEYYTAVVPDACFSVGPSMVRHLCLESTVLSQSLGAQPTGCSNTHTQSRFNLKHRSVLLGHWPGTKKSGLKTGYSVLVIKTEMKVQKDWRNVNFLRNQVSFLWWHESLSNQECKCKVAEVHSKKRGSFSVAGLLLQTLPCPPSIMSGTTNRDNFLSNAVIMKMSPLRH